jgi:hypothetical protein
MSLQAKLLLANCKDPSPAHLQEAIAAEANHHVTHTNNLEKNKAISSI